MKKVMKLVALITIIGMFGAFAMSASAEEFDDYSDLIAFGWGEDRGDIILEFRVPARGVGPENIIAWGWEGMKIEVTGDLETDYKHSPAKGLGEDIVIANMTGSAKNGEGGFGAAFGEDVNAGKCIVFFTIEGTQGTVRMTAEVFEVIVYDPENPLDGKSFQFEFDETFTFPVDCEVCATCGLCCEEDCQNDCDPVCECSDVTTAPATSGPQITNAATTAAGTTVATTAAAASTSAPAATSAPKGGVALAIIPTFIAAGAALVASRKSK